ncbi:MAG: inverse autotransporter beta domain-containing protein [Ewingella americana]|jgi:adhesin/invasin|uniref:invasin domain 3-containing protein n=1 Tax=Ewingella americana TaxID=41202 RepID=UPI0024302134|nr:invasin domain 3-containing protein [Ewingella americana]MCI1678273.1 inverse autotransporter beta domain-containing protein [Ewingella americana]MCI1856090.1 inverse autotransporter beta domain-containing protein [Ewingella americana]MCI1862315.1 inverse autotransporter beta domain-containing protein [Ewingella americana]MCI2142732.1 inverse autotransporter beta domain-containing protein [Ewingella americana]MCI2162523.1 inverse autotransporter beta domain-containing protein [Ewingella ame
MKVSSAHFIKRRTAVVGWLTIFTQAALPLSFAYAPLVQAAQDPAAKWYQSGNNDLNAQSIFENHSDTLASSGSALSEGNAAGMARSAATGAVNNSIEEWLGQFGTARVQLNLDDKFKAEGSEADLLVPLYENKDNILFTQLGFRHKDERNTGNLGLGVRHFTGDWMLGANTFFDNDFTGENRRMGVGVEAWRDYLKLSANSYIRLSDWHQSRDFEDYDERPANGYDLRAEGWLPAFPQLGAKVMYEQYQGDEVALFGKDNRQKDPWAFTGGVNYTPIPLLTLAAQHRAGKDGQSDSQLSLQMNYRLGESWSKQVDPNLVGASRTLNGTRYDLVERNNSIVLDYRKQETVKLVVPEKTSGKSRSTVPVSFTVETKNPLQRIDWDASSLVAAGGSLTQVGSNQLSITMPPYQAAGSNVYRFAGVAYDAKGNSGSTTGELHVEVGEVSAGATTVSANPTTITANGTNTSTLSIGLFDAEGNPVPGMGKSLTSSIKETLAAKQASTAPVQSAVVGPIEETSPGVYQAVVTAGTRAGTAVVSSQFNDIALPDITITQSADAATGHIDSGAILVATDNSAANDSSMNEVNAVITDSGSNPLPNAPVTFSLTGSATVAPGSSLNAMTDEKGRVGIRFINKVAEKVTVTATLENGNSGSIDTHFIADSNSATMSNGDVGVDKDVIVANNVDFATFKAVVKDANGNPVPKFTVNWSNDKGSLSANSSDTNENGETTVTLKHTVAEAAQVVATAGSSGNINAPVVNFKGDSGNLSAANSALAATPDTIVANGTETSTIQLTLKDGNHNAVTGQAVTFSSNLGGNFGTVTDNGDGTYSAPFTSTTAGAASITANVGGSSFGVTAATVTVKADSDNLSTDKSALTVSDPRIVANGVATSTITLSLKDAHNNAVSGLNVDFGSDLANSSIGSVTDNGDGTYSAPLTGTTAGTTTITTTVGGSNFGVTAASVILTADSNNLSPADSALAATPDTIVADGTTPSTIQLTLKDVNKNPVEGLTVAFNSSLGGNFGTVTDHGDGTYSALFTGTTAGTANISATVNGSSFGVAPTPVTLKADSNNLSAADSALAATPDTIVADGTTASTIQLTLKDVNKNPVEGLAVTFNSSLGGNFGTVTDHGDGTYSAPLTGTTAGSASITANVGGTPFAVTAISVTLTADKNNLSPDKSELTSSPASIVADGTTASTIQLTLKDANNNPVNGLNVTFNSTLADSNFGSVTDHGDGTYSAPLTGTTAGAASITANVGGTPFAVTATSVALTADKNNLSPDKSELTGSPASIVADGTTASTIQLTLKDANNNPVNGLNVTFNSTLADSNFGSVTDHGDGTYSAPLTGTTAGAASITANVGGTPFGVSAKTVTLIADKNNLSTAKSELVAAPLSIVANGTESSTIQLSLKDANNNPVNGLVVTFDSSLANSGAGSVTDHGDGTYSAPLTGTTSGSASITTKIGGTPFTVAPASVTLTGDITTAKVTTLASNVVNLIGNGSGAAIYTATVRDAHNNLVEGASVSWGTTSGSMSDATSTTNSSGEAVSTLSGITRTASTNTSATVTATAIAGNKTANITVRTVVQVGTRFYWSMTNLNDTNEAGAQAKCALYGGGRVLEETDLADFKNGGGNYNTKSTSDGEYLDKWYRYAGQWTTRTVDLYGNVGRTEDWEGESYTCIK